MKSSNKSSSSNSSPKKLKKVKIKSAKKRKLTGIRYIQRVLHKYYPKRYPTFASAKERAVQIKFLMSGEKYTVKNVLSYERKPRVKKQDDPVLSYELTNPINYFNLANYPTLISNADSRINFRSKLFDYPLVGGDLPDYNLYFNDFVKHCDKIRNSISKNSDYTTDWFVRCSEPYFNATTKRWESLIYSCDDSGQEEDYGFSPNTITDVLSSEIKSKSKNDKEVPKIEESSSEELKQGKSDKELEIEKIKAETELLKEQNRNKLFELHAKGILSDSELKKALGL